MQGTKSTLGMMAKFGADVDELVAFFFFILGTN